MSSARKTHRQAVPQARQTRQPSKRFWTRTRIAVAVTALAVTTALGLATFSRPETRRAPNPILDTDLQLLDGGTFRLAEYDGRVVVLNFWATWCGPCRSEIPHLVEMNGEYKGRGVEFIGLSTEEPLTAREKVRNFAAQYRMDYRLGFSERQWAARLMQDKTNIPQLFVLRDGRVLNRFIGFNDARPQQLRDAIEQALKTN
ncbi:MAG TPA: TlpA disulfide reductase family protein [Pyrinomonadaceae bacterium]|nr:TlpA disulfide reductase family protein [Pyrinomonadaceae bacterium]